MSTPTPRTDGFATGDDGSTWSDVERKWVAPKMSAPTPKRIAVETIQTKIGPRDVITDVQAVVAQFERLERDRDAWKAKARRLYAALQWTMNKTPSPCRCVPFSIPPHVCVAHAALGLLGRTAKDES